MGDAATPSKESAAPRENGTNVRNLADDSTPCNDPALLAAGEAALAHGADAALVVDDQMLVGNLEAVAGVLERFDYRRQAALVRAHDPRCGAIVVHCHASGRTRTWIHLPPALGAA